MTPRPKLGGELLRYLAWGNTNFCIRSLFAVISRRAHRVQVQPNRPGSALQTKIGPTADSLLFSRRPFLLCHVFRVISLSADLPPIATRFPRIKAQMIDSALVSLLLHLAER